MTNTTILNEMKKKVNFINWPISTGLISSLDVEIRIALDKARLEGKNSIS